jgi:hypothetical protein
MNSPFNSYNGRQYYAVGADMSAPAVQIDMRRLQALANEGWPVGERANSSSIDPSTM